jgi:hypothetical protein
MTWKRLIDKWVKRLLPEPGWRVRIEETTEIEEPATAICYAERYPYRQATIQVRLGMVPNNAVACHEVCHILLAQATWPAQWMIDEMAREGAPQGIAKKWLEKSEEQVAEALTRAFLAAHKEEDSE